MTTQIMAIRILVKRSELRKKREADEEEDRGKMVGEDDSGEKPKGKGPRTIDEIFPPSEGREGGTQFERLAGFSPM